MITGILFYEKELEEYLKHFLQKGMETFETRHKCKATIIALNKEQFEADKYKPILTKFEKKGLTILFLSDVNKNHYQIGRSDEFLNRVIRPEKEIELSVS